jgi:GT2 family glycosyltransferase
VPKPLIVIPTYATKGQDNEILDACLRSIRGTIGGDADVLVVDDGSPAEDLKNGIRTMVERIDGEVVFKRENSGFSRTVNVGLRRALAEGRDAILCNADIEFDDQSGGAWLDRMLAQRTSDGSELAPIVGARLLYPNGLIQHAGIYFSLLTRSFGHIYQWGPGNMPEANRPRVCPVTGALQFIRASTLEKLGVYDETFRMSYEDVDYCVRAWKAGLECIYAPGVIATHHESVFRRTTDPNSKLARWQHESWLRFIELWGSSNFAEFVPSLAGES